MLKVTDVALWNLHYKIFCSDPWVCLTVKSDVQSSPFVFSFLLYTFPFMTDNTFLFLLRCQHEDCDLLLFLHMFALHFHLWSCYNSISTGFSRHAPPLRTVSVGTTGLDQKGLTSLPSVSTTFGEVLTKHITSPKC